MKLNWATRSWELTWPWPKWDPSPSHSSPGHPRCALSALTAAVVPGGGSKEPVSPDGSLEGDGLESPLWPLFVALSRQRPPTSLPRSVVSARLTSEMTPEHCPCQSCLACLTLNSRKYLQVKSWYVVEDGTLIIVRNILGRDGQKKKKHTPVSVLAFCHTNRQKEDSVYIWSPRLKIETVTHTGFRFPQVTTLIDNLKKCNFILFILK